MLKRKLCVIWIWYLLYDNARFQRWLARHRRHGWELADVGCIFFRFERGDGTRYRYYMQMMKDDPDTKRGRDYLAGVEELGVTCLGCFWHRAFFRWEDDGRPVEMFSDLASRALEAKCVRSAQLALDKNGIKAEIHVITGSVEISPGIGLADGIFDIVFMLVFGKRIREAREAFSKDNVIDLGEQ